MTSQYSSDLIFPIAATVVGGLLVWVIIYLIKVVINQGKETGDLKTEITVLNNKVYGLTETLNTEIAQVESKLHEVEIEIKQAADERLKLHQLVEDKLINFRNGLDEKLDKMFAKVNRISEDVAVIKSKQAK